MPTNFCFVIKQCLFSDDASTCHHQQNLTNCQQNREKLILCRVFGSNYLCMRICAGIYKASGHKKNKSFLFDFSHIRITWRANVAILSLYSRPSRFVQNGRREQLVHFIFKRLCCCWLVDVGKWDGMCKSLSFSRRVGEECRYFYNFFVVFQQSLFDATMRQKWKCIGEQSWIIFYHPSSHYIYSYKWGLNTKHKCVSVGEWVGVVYQSVRKKARWLCWERSSKD